MGEHDAGPSATNSPAAGIDIEFDVAPDGSLVQVGPPADGEFKTARGLLASLGYPAEISDDASIYLEDYVWNYLDEDLGMNLFVTIDGNEGGEELYIYAKMSFDTQDAVNMWILHFPVTIDQFHRYLNELDLRVARLREIVELPNAAEDAGSDDKASVVDILGRVFGATDIEVSRELGDDWRPISDDNSAVGFASTPVRYLSWKNRLVVGLDDEYVHLFTQVIDGDTVDVGNVITHFALGDVETIPISEFARLLRAALPEPETWPPSIPT